MKRFLFLFIVFILGLTITPVHASTIALELTVSDYPQILEFATMRGWLFETNQDITVDALGLWDRDSDGFATGHNIGIWTSDGSNLLFSYAVPSGTSGILMGPVQGHGEFRYFSISGVSLSAGQQYVIAADVTGDYFINDNIDVITSAAEITWIQGRFTGPGVVWPTFPTQSVPGNKYFGPNFTFTATTPIPEPATMLLLGSGLLGLLGLRRKLAK